MLAPKPKSQKVFDRTVPSPFNSIRRERFLQIAPAEQTIGEWPGKEGGQAFARDIVLALQEHAETATDADDTIGIKNEGFHLANHQQQRREPAADNAPRCD
jgi:hypothetical protein